MLGSLPGPEGGISWGWLILCPSQTKELQQGAAARGSRRAGRHLEWRACFLQFLGGGEGEGRVSLVHLRSDCPQHYGERGSPMGTPKVNFPLFLYPVGSSYKIAPSLVMPSLKEKHLFQVPQQIIPLLQRCTFPHDGARPRGHSPLASFEFCRLWRFW